MTVVVDSSVVTAALVDSGSLGRWARSVLLSEPLSAPHLMPAEVANVLRRRSLVGSISAETASLAHRDLLDLPVDLEPYDVHASRIWRLRTNVTAYDAWYVAVAEALDAHLATLDVRLTRAAGPLCAFLTPPG